MAASVGPTPPIHLLVTADDYALTSGTSRAIIRAHREGVVTATSVLALGRAFNETVPWLADCPSLAVGAHLALAGEDLPVSSPRAIPTLVDAGGRLAPTWQVFVRRLLAGRIDPEDVEREWVAQWDRLAEAGLEVTHLNTHQHLHLWPSVGRVLVALAEKWHVPVVRAPTAEGVRLRSAAIRVLARRLRSSLVASDLVHPMAFAGLVDAGRLDGPRLRATLDRLARDRPASAEIVVHVGEDDDSQRRPSEQAMHWARELDGLVDPATQEALDRLGYRLCSPKELAEQRWLER